MMLAIIYLLYLVYISNIILGTMQYFYQFYKIGTLSCHIQNIVQYI